MKTPEAGTEVFMPIALNAPGNDTQITTNFPVDLSMAFTRPGGDGSNTTFVDRLRGFPTTNTSSGNRVLVSASTTAEYADTAKLFGWDNTSVKVGSGQGSGSFVNYFLKRAPGFMDVVCWTSTASTNRRINHNLTVPPELILCKSRNNAQNWAGYVAPLGINKGVVLNNTGASFNATGLWGTSAPTSTDFGMDESYYFPSGYTVVTYLFATCPGVSKVGSYTGTGADLNVDCGFSAGARFILIKRTDSTGDWYVWDSARGIAAGNDPYLLLNSTAAEVTSTDYIDPLASGFTVTSSAPAALNASGGSFIFFAVA